MAGDWIKMRSDLYRDPKVCVIADALMAADSDLARQVDQHCQRNMTVTRNVMRNAAVGALVSIWGVFRQRGKVSGVDLVAPGINLSVLDDVADMPGFGEAMASVGWAIQNDEGVVFPLFFNTYNADPDAAQKQKNAERQRRFRERQHANGESNDRNVTVTARNADRIEKRRVDNKEGGAAPKPPERALPPTNGINSQEKELTSGKIRARKKIEYPAEFEAFWSAYPRRIAKSPALKAWTSAVKRVDDPQTLTVAAAEFAGCGKVVAALANGEERYIPHPSTWLNQGRWEDDRATWEEHVSNRGFDLSAIKLPGDE